MPEGVLVIGATGFVGKSLVARLSSVVPEIYTISRGEGVFHGISNVRHYRACLDNDCLLNELLPKCKVVFHLASETTPSVSILQPSFEAVNNLLPSLRFLECLQKFSHVHLVYVSTGGAIYGDCDRSRATENVPLSPLSYYGAGKAALEKFIHAYSQQTGNASVILRPSNFYGPGQLYRQGFGIIPTIFKHILERKAIQVWGEGNATRDYLFIQDFIDFCLVLFEKIPNQGAASIYNVGSGKGVTLIELINIIEEITGESIVKQFKAARSVDVKRIVLDISRVKNQFNWQPATDLRKGLVKTWDWFRAHHL